LGPLALCRRFGHAAHKEHRDLPLMVVRHLKNMEKIVALTDGSDLAENTLGLLLKINSFISGKITLVGMTGAESKAASSDALNLERGLAILNEKGIQAAAHSASELGAERLTVMLKEADLLVNPLHRQEPLHLTSDLHEDDIQAVLLYLSR
jgi:hypothetical protein